jgi:hypothetical protein
MSTAAASAALSVGSSVVLDEAYIAVFECFDLRGVICEVVDVRKGGTDYAFTIAPVASLGVDRTRSREVFADDLRSVRS